MEKPNYILKTNEAVLVPVTQNKGITFLKIGVWVVVIIIVLGSLIFKDNLFAELSWTSRFLLIAIAASVLVIGGKKEDVPSPMEIQFYDEYLILYRPKCYYSKKITRMEVNKMMYSEIKRCVFKTRSQRLHIYGDVIATWYNFNSEGERSQSPTYNRTVKDTLCFFSTLCANGIDFKHEIETHSPVIVTEENS